MDQLTFIANVIASIAWPAAALILVLLFKKEIIKIAPYLKRFKAGPVEAEFAREVQALKESTPVQQPTAKSPMGRASRDFLFELAALHPRSAVLEAWVRLEAAARAALPKPSTPGSMSSYLPAARLPEPLVSAAIIDQSQVTMFHELRRLRNDVAHLKGTEPTQESVLSYIELASTLQEEIEKHGN